MINKIIPQSGTVTFYGNRDKKGRFFLSTLDLNKRLDKSYKSDKDKKIKYKTLSTSSNSSRSSDSSKSKSSSSSNSSKSNSSNSLVHKRKNKDDRHINGNQNQNPNINAIRRLHVQDINRNMENKIRIKERDRDIIDNTDKRHKRDNRDKRDRRDNIDNRDRDNRDKRDKRDNRDNRDKDDKYISLIQYGDRELREEHYNDVTAIIVNKCYQDKKDQCYLLGGSDVERDTMFRDPWFLHHKHLLITYSINDRVVSSERIDEGISIIFQLVRGKLYKLALLNNVNEQKVMDAVAVISVYTDTLNFVSELHSTCPFLRYQIFDKSESRKMGYYHKVNDKLSVPVKPLKNVGMDIYAIFEYIIDNYKSLPYCVWFITGGIDSASYKKEKLDYLMENWQSVYIDGYVEMQTLKYVKEFTLDYWKTGSLSSNNNNACSDGNLIPAKYRPIDKWISSTLNTFSSVDMNEIINQTGISYNNIFIVRKDRILQHPIELYKKLREELEAGGKQSEVAHYIERIWKMLFSIDHREIRNNHKKSPHRGTNIIQ